MAATETHIHADFLSGTRELAERHGAKLYLSDEGDADWKYRWANSDDYDVQLLEDGDSFQIGNIRIEALHTPGHTPEHMSFLVTDLGGGASEPIGIATGDFVFVGDLGRPDLLETAAGIAGAREPSARRLYESTKRFLDLQDHLQVWPGHGAGSVCGKALGAVPQSTAGYERRFNVALSFDEEATFVDAILDGQPEPPLYFARMKDLNKNGVPLIGTLPTPARVSAEQLTALRGLESAVVLDTRIDREAFMAGHIAGSIYSPLGVAFPMVVGSYVDPAADIYLIADEGAVDEAVRTLIRIGYDRVVGYVTPEAVENSADLVSTKWIDFGDFESKPDASEATIIDVRGAAEFSGTRVSGSMNIAHTRLATRLDEVQRDKPVMVYCRTGTRASAAASFLETSGYDVTVVNGLFADWPGWKGEVVEAGAGRPA